MKLLLIKEKHSKYYRLHCYQDFYNQINDYCDTYVYGKDTEGYDPNKTIDDIISDMGERPDVIFVFAPIFKFSSWANIKAIKCFLVTDSFGTVEKMQKSKFYPRMDEIPWNYVFHNYLYQLDFMKSQLLGKFIYYPNWASSIYDYEIYKRPKNIDFFMSGKYSSEYPMRKRFSKIFKKWKPGFRVLNKFKDKRINEEKDNTKYRTRLLFSKYSPHDGSVFGRLVPRFLESCFAKSVIISPHLGEEMDRCGFVNNVNYFKIARKSTSKEIRSKIKEIWLHADWKETSQAAYDLVKNNHTTEHRIKQFLEVVNEG